MRCRLLLAAALVSFQSVTTISSQSEQAGPGAIDAFEVASIRRNVSNGKNSSVAYKGELFTMTNFPLRDIIAYAYGIDFFYAARFAVFEGLPEWTNERYDIVAKTEGPTAKPSRDDLNRPIVGPLHIMLQGLLADRFKLSMRQEERSRPGQALVMAGERVGPGIRRSDTNCAAYIAASKKARAEGLPPPRPNPEWRGHICGRRSFSRNGQHELYLHSQSLQALADEIGWAQQALVADRTGLTGLFNIELVYVAGQRGPSTVGSIVAGLEVAGASNPEGPSLQSALKDQLGLKLEHATASIRVFVLEHIERPSPN
jgi:uncharacterized protein (TIGR03435 family)